MTGRCLDVQMFDQMEIEMELPASAKTFLKAWGFVHAVAILSLLERTPNAFPRASCWYLPYFPTSFISNLSCSFLPSSHHPHLPLSHLPMPLHPTSPCLNRLSLPLHPTFPLPFPSSSIYAPIFFLIPLRFVLSPLSMPLLNCLRCLCPSLIASVVYAPPSPHSSPPR